MLQRSLDFALPCLLLCVSCCPDMAPSTTATPLQYPTGLSEDEKAAIRWKLSRSNCATDATTTISGVLSIIFAGLSTPTPSGIDCELRTSLELPPNTYLRSLTVHARGALVIEPKGGLTSMVDVRRECDDRAALIALGRTYDWTAPNEPGSEPDGPLLLDLSLGGTAVMEAGGDRMCGGRNHVIDFVTLVRVADPNGLGSSAGLDSVDLLADVADCSGPRFESLCEWAEIAYRRVASTDDVDPPTLEVVDALAYGLTPGTTGPSEPSCRDDAPVVRHEAERRLQGRREALVPLLHERCSEPLPSESRDLFAMVAVEERRCRAQDALAFLGEGTQSCKCRAGGTGSEAVPIGRAH